MVVVCIQKIRLISARVYRVSNVKKQKDGTSQKKCS